MPGIGATHTKKGTTPFPVSHPFPPASLLHLPADFHPLLPAQSLQGLQFYDNVPPCFQVGEWGAERSACPPARSLARPDGLGEGTEAAGRSREGKHCGSNMKEFGKEVLAT